MQHGRVAIYKVKPGGVDVVIQRAQAGMLPIFKAQAGFIAYGLVKTGDDEIVSFSLWQTGDQASAASQMAATWVRENVAEYLVSVENHIGDVAFLETSGPLGA